MPAASTQSISSVAQEEQPAAGLDHQAIGLRLIAAQILDQRQEAAAEVAVLVAFELFAGALQRVGEALAVERLQQVVERPHLERLQRVLIVGGDEDDERHLVGADRLDHLEAVHLRHLHVEEHEVRRVVVNSGDGLFAVARLRDQFESGSCESRLASRSRASGSSSATRTLIFFMTGILRTVRKRRPGGRRTLSRSMPPVELCARTRFGDRPFVVASRLPPGGRSARRQGSATITARPCGSRWNSKR